MSLIYIFNEKIYCCCGIAAGANFDTKLMPECKIFRNIAGVLSLFAKLSIDKRNSKNTLRVCGLRRDEYLNTRK